MLGFYFILSGALVLLCFFNRTSFVRLISAVVFLVLQGSLAVYAVFHLHSTEMKYFSFDATGVIFLGVLSLLSISTIYHSFGYLSHRKDNRNKQSTYFTALYSLIISMTGVYLANHIALMWCFVEATTLSVSFLIYHERTAIALEATWKYVFICSIGVTLAFVGIIFLGTAIREGGSVDMTFSSMAQHLKGANILWLKMAFLFILIGFSTKMGLFPMHPITVDAHTVAPPPISAFISTALMNVGFVAIFRTYTLLAGTAIHTWMNHVLLVSGLLSIFVSAIYLLKAKHLKRMSAYSSLEHMGLAALGLAAGGIGYFAAIFHLVLHSLVKASIFYQAGLIHRVYKTYLISDTGNYFRKHLPGAMVILLAFIGITAIPPSGMFITEFWLMTALFRSSYYLVMVLALIFLAVAMYGLGKNMFSLLFSNTSHKENEPEVHIPFREYIPQYILLALVIYLGINPPDLLVNLINEAIKTLPV